MTENVQTIRNIIIYDYLWTIFYSQFKIVCRVEKVKSKFLQKLEIFGKNRIFYKKSNFLQKIEIFYKKSKFLQKIEIFTKKRISYDKLF